jgi:hypothetical protein
MIFFSLTNVLFSPSLTFCLTLFQIAIKCPLLLCPFYFHKFWEHRAWTFRICKDIRGPKYIWVKITHFYKFTQILEPSLHPYYNLKLKIDVTICMFSYFKVQTFFYVFVKRCICLYVYYLYLVMIVVICLLRSNSD